MSDQCQRYTAQRKRRRLNIKRKIRIAPRRLMRHARTITHLFKKIMPPSLATNASAMSALERMCDAKQTYMKSGHKAIAILATGT